MHTMRSVPELAAIRRVVQAGEIGDPLIIFSQKSYKWGETRPDYYRVRKTFPGLAPWVGIHAFDWMYWIVGDVFTEIFGREAATARPDYPACASQAAFVLTMANGGVASVTLDYLRPESAPTHGDERLRIAGTLGLVETALVEHKAELIRAGHQRSKLPLFAQPDVFTQFVRSLRGETSLPFTLHEACRITEIALKAQQSAERGQPISLRESIYQRRG
jgi:predicted dehydrogenase